MAPPVPPSEHESPLVRALLADLGIEEGGLVLDIAAEDEMLTFLVDTAGGDRERALYGYFQSGAAVAAAMGQVVRWRHGDPRRIGRLLDFASGYGRVTRFLLRLVPPEKLWVSDIYADGVRFQERRLGVHGIVSTLLPDDFPGTVAAAVAAGPGDGGSGAAGFDAILVTSLFTHLPEERFVAWLRVLMGLLAPGGVLAFSVHDRCLIPEGAPLPESGLLFQEISESGSLATHDYGSTWVSEDFVRAALARAMAADAVGGGGSLHRLERGLCGYQDLYVAVPEAAADFSRLAFRGEPRYFVERCVMVGTDRLEASGWAALPGGAVTAVEIVLDDALIGRFPVDLERPEVALLLGDPSVARSGWAGACAVPAGTSRSASVLRLRLVDDLGNLHPVVASTLEAALHAGSRNAVAHLAGRLRDVEAERDRAAAQVTNLQARLAAMEASRFWKLRNLWFRLKSRWGFGAA
jgi:SAM-dependent methyltransferase